MCLRAYDFCTDLLAFRVIDALHMAQLDGRISRRALIMRLSSALGRPVEYQDCRGRDSSAEHHSGAPSPVRPGYTDAEAMCLQLCLLVVPKLSRPHFCSAHVPTTIKADLTTSGSRLRLCQLPHRRVSVWLLGTSVSQRWFWCYWSCRCGSVICICFTECA